MPPFTLSMESFSPIFTSIDVPEDCYFYRGYNPQYPTVGHRPAYYTTQLGIAKSYADQFNTHVGLFKTTRPLRIYDLRFIKHLLIEMLEQRARPTTSQLKGSIMTVSNTLSFFKKSSLQYCSLYPSQRCAYRTLIYTSRNARSRPLYPIIHLAHNFYLYR
jgi:hypothetical protein